MRPWASRQRPPHSTWRARPTVVATAVILVVSVLMLLGRTSTFLHDDAYITLRYAHNLLNGHGIVWNPGERVEGYTHPLWLLQVAGLGHAGLALPIAARVLSYLYLLGIVGVWLRSRAHPSLLAVTCTLHGLLLWCNGGLEVVGFSFWLLAGAWGLFRLIESRSPPRALPYVCGACFALAALMRPDGVGAGLIALVVLASVRRFAALPGFGLAFGAPVLAHLLFRVSYYGDWLPNTAYAKAAGLPLGDLFQSGWYYLRATRGEWFPALFVAGAVALLQGHRRSWLVALVGVPLVASALAGGGDHMPGARLLIPPVVFVLFVVAYTLRGVTLQPGLRRAATVVVVWQMALTAFVPRPADWAAVSGSLVGTILDTYLPPGTVVAASTAGSTPYHAADLRFIDMLGLNDRHIGKREITSLETRWQRTPGHQKGDGAYVLAQRPSVIILGPTTGFLGHDPYRWFLSDLELLRSEEFRREYQPYLFQPADELRGQLLSEEIIMFLRRGTHVGQLRARGRPLPFPDAEVASLHRVPTPDHPRSVSLVEPLAEATEVVRGFFPRSHTQD